jgi:hypothetical protein
MSVVARPLLLILQDTFWTDLMKSFFKYFHPSCTLFSLTNFDPKTASESLISAIYFAGFIYQPNFPEEIRSYMHSYAICNVKKALFSVKISSVQALGIYSVAFYLIGNSSLSRVCLSHFARMGHLLGISIKRNNLTIIDQHNRKLIYNIYKLYYNWIKLGQSSCDVTSEEDEADLDIYEPKYQLPNSSLILFNNRKESTIYSIFCSQFSKLMNLSIMINSKFCNYDSIRLKGEIEMLKTKVNEIYSSAKLTLESLVSSIPEYKFQILVYLEMIKAPFIASILSIYSKLFKRSKNINVDLIQAILDKGIELWALISSNKSLIEIWSWSPYMVAFHLIQVHPHCAKKQKKTIIFILKSIIHLYHNEGYNSNSLNFIILKSQFNLINS